MGDSAGGSRDFCARFVGFLLVLLLAYAHAAQKKGPQGAFPRFKLQTFRLSNYISER